MTTDGYHFKKIPKSMLLIKCASRYMRMRMEEGGPKHVCIAVHQVLLHFPQGPGALQRYVLTMCNDRYKLHCCCWWEAAGNKLVWHLQKHSCRGRNGWAEIR